MTVKSFTQVSTSYEGWAAPYCENCSKHREYRPDNIPTIGGCLTLIVFFFGSVILGASGIHSGKVTALVVAAIAMSIILVIFIAKLKRDRVRRTVKPRCTCEHFAVGYLGEVKPEKRDWSAGPKKSFQRFEFSNQAYAQKFAQANNGSAVTERHPRRKPPENQGSAAS
jgi:hypothetical protein